MAILEFIESMIFSVKYRIGLFHRNYVSFEVYNFQNNSEYNRIRASVKWIHLIFDAARKQRHSTEQTSRQRNIRFIFETEHA